MVPVFYSFNANVENMNRRIFTGLLAVSMLSLSMASCGDDDGVIDYSGKVEEVVDDGSGWPVLKHRKYVDGTFRGAVNYNAHPHFRVACGISAGELLDMSNPACKAVLEHFDEVTMGNEQKYASIVDDNGNMNFETVKKLVAFCRQNQITLYGHTLAWHSQQRDRYLANIANRYDNDLDKKDAITKAMEKWIDGCMKATDGYVTCWDAVNEAISGGGDYKGKGIYVLQGHGNTDPNNLNKESGVFYWQDFLGAEDYIPIVVNTARAKFKLYGGNPDHLKLFINDYNLESDWDGNKKLKSLIEWIKIWESKGCRVDGIGTQMHISCYEDNGIMANKKRAIENMFKLMAQTGKLCKISELDMGYQRKNGTSAHYDNLTEAEAQKMADYYEWVVTKYFEIIPPAQQYAICQWCLTDSPKNSGWRAGDPAGFWKLDFADKWPMFDGFLKGLENSKKYD